MDLERIKRTIIEHHYLQSWPAGESRVYEYRGAIVVISRSGNPFLFHGTDAYVWELSRLWAPDGHERDLLTQAISHAVHEFKCEPDRRCNVIISYADPRHGHSGRVYKLAGWTALGQADPDRAWKMPD